MENGCLKIFESFFYTSLRFYHSPHLPTYRDVTSRDLMHNRNKGGSLLYITGTHTTLTEK